MEWRFLMNLTEEQRKLIIYALDDLKEYFSAMKKEEDFDDLFRQTGDSLVCAVKELYNAAVISLGPLELTDGIVVSSASESEKKNTAEEYEQAIEKTDIGLEKVKRNFDSLKQKETQLGMYFTDQPVADRVYKRDIDLLAHLLNKLQEIQSELPDLIHYLIQTRMEKAKELQKEWNDGYRKWSSKILTLNGE
jgi:hypothetical protein